MSRIIIWLCLYCITSGALWSAITFSTEWVFHISLSECVSMMIGTLIYHAVNNTGQFLLSVGILALIVMIILKKFGIPDMLMEKINEIGGFNRFRISIRYFAHNFTSNKESPTLTFIVQVKNVGFNQSNLTEWSLYFVTEDGKDFAGKPLYQASTINIDLPDQRWSFPINMSLYKLTQSPIAPGVSVAGVIQFAIPHLRGEMITKKCTVILKAKDNKDKKIEFRTNIEIFYEQSSEIIAELHDIITNATKHDVTTK